jgi:tripartite-type tricarboxylate transporter receptor subunit TctC
VSYATGGAGSSGHLAAELFARRAGVTLVHVPFRGSPPAIQSLIAGDVQLLWDTPTAATRGYIEQKQMKALAVMTRTRLPAFRTFRRSARPGSATISTCRPGRACWCAPARRRRSSRRLHKAIVQAMALPDTRARIEAMSVEPMATDPAAFDAFFKSEVARWTEVARAGLTVQ